VEFTVPGSDVHSARWWKPMLVLMDNYVKAANSFHGDDLLFIDTKVLRKIFLSYEKELHKYKKSRHLLGNQEEHNVDRHKIIALYVKVFLYFEPIVVNKSHLKNFKDLEKDKQDSIRYANEFFCIKLIEFILSGDGWKEDNWNEKKRVERRLSFTKENEKTWLVILLNHYRFHPQTLDVLSLAQIIYYIEKDSFN